MARIDPTDLQAEAEDREEAELRNREARKQEQTDIEWLMKHKQGRRFMARLLDKAGIHRTTFRANSEMPFLEGMRNLGLIFFNDVMEFTPAKWVELLTEQKEAKEHERSKRQSR